MIYEYLHHPIEVDCLVDEVVVDDHTFGDNGVSEIRVKVEQAPITDVMLVHSRFYEEYHESIMFKNYSATFKIAQVTALVRPLKRQLISSLGPILPHLRHVTLSFDHDPDHYPKQAYILDKFRATILKKQGMRSFNLVFRMTHYQMPGETVDDIEDMLPDFLLTDKFEGTPAVPPPPGMTLIQMGRGAAFSTCGHRSENIDGHYNFRVNAFASRSGDECYWTPESVLALYPLARGRKTLETILLENPGIPAQERVSTSMRLSKMALWNDTRKAISSEVIESIAATYLKGETSISKENVADLNDGDVCKFP